MISKERIMKEFKEWGIFLGVILILYLTGLHTQVAAFAQRAVLATGIVSASELPDNEKEDADYNMRLRSLQSDEIFDFSDYKGKVVFINFWASWCAPCIAEMPNIQSLYEKVASDNIKFLMISLDQNESKARKFIDKKGYTFPTYTPEGYLPDVYRSPSIPTTFVISPEGKIVSKRVGMANYDKKSFRNFLEKLTSDR